MPPSIVRALQASFLAARSLPVAARGVAQDATRQALGLELAKVLIDDQMQRGFTDQVSLSMLRVIGALLQERLNRRLQESEGRTLAEIVRGFVVRTLPPARVEEIAARAYASHFDEAECGRCSTSSGRRSAGRPRGSRRRSGSIPRRPSRARSSRSPAMPRLMEELQAAFPVLRSQESP